MSDLNKDLIGKTMNIDHTVYVVLHSSPTMPQYVVLEREPGGPLRQIIRPAAVVRRHLEMLGIVGEPA